MQMLSTRTALMCLLFFCGTAKLLAQQNPNIRTLEGRVVSEANSGLPDVNIILEEVVSRKRLTFSTNQSGAFTITPVFINRKYNMYFSHVGYTSDTIVNRSFPKSFNQEIVIRLKELKDVMDEVVVVGYGELKKSDVTGAISSIKIGDEAKNRPVSNLAELIQGKASGVQIINNSGMPGSSITFNIRGVSSFSDNSPLVIIDGVPVPADNYSQSSDDGGLVGSSLRPMVTNSQLATLNPNDVESIEILKDASSTAIYGSRASNGVVLITTKKGKQGRDRIEYNFNITSTELTKQYEVLNSKEYMDYVNEAYENDGKAVPYPHDSLYDQRVLTSRDWQDMIFQKGVSMDHQLSFSGGDAKTKYSVTANYNSAEGRIITSRFQRYSVRANLERKISNRLSLSLGTSYTEAISNAVPHSVAGGGTSNELGVMTMALAYQPFRSEDWETLDIVADRQNPLALIYNRTDVYKNRSLSGRATLTYNILKGLNFKLNTSFFSYIGDRDFYSGHRTALGRNGPNGYAAVFNNRNYNYLAEYTFNYNRQFKKHRINAVAGYTWQDWKNRGLIASAADFPSDATLYYNFNLANIINRPSQSFSNYSLASYLGRAVYSYDNRYVLTLTGRYDGSTRLAKGNQWSFFPSVGASWNVTSEQFMKSQAIFKNLKFRASWGQSGNQVISPGSSQLTLFTNKAVFGNNIVVGYLPGNLANDQLRWETTSAWNWGTDMEFVNGRVRFSADYYIKDTKDQLGNYPLPMSTSYGSIPTNLGKIRNQGLDMDLSVDLIKRKIEWTFSGNISFNRNKILDLGDLDEIITSRVYNDMSIPFQISQVGQSMYNFRGFLVDGIYQSQQEVDDGPVDTAVPNTPGSLKFVDTNGDGEINEKDIVILGSPLPKYTFGITNDLSYKSFSLNALITSSMGNKIANLVRYRLEGMVATSLWNITKEAYDNRWTGEGSSNSYGKPTVTGTPFNGRFTNSLLEDGSYVRLKSVTLGYQLPLRQMKMNRLQGVRVFVTGTNLITITKYKGYDPEVSTSGSTAPGVDNYTMPQGRSYTAGINVQF